MKLSACRIAVAAALGTLLVSCVEPGPPAPAPAAVAKVPPPKNTPSNVVPIVQPDRTQSPEATQMRLAALRKHNMPSPVDKPAEPDIIIGLAQYQVENMIGKPDSVREEPPATVWVYSAEQCTLDIYFYLDVKSNKLTALSYHTETSGPPGESDESGEAGNKAAARSCLGQLQTEMKSGKP